MFKIKKGKLVTLWLMEELMALHQLAQEILALQSLLMKGEQLQHQMEEWLRMIVVLLTHENHHQSMSSPLLIDPAASSGTAAARKTRSRVGTLGLVQLARAWLAAGLWRARRHVRACVRRRTARMAQRRHARGGVG